MTITGHRFADDDHNNVLATTDRLKPAREQPCVWQAYTRAHLVWIGQCISDSLAIFGKQIGMSFGNVPFAFLT